MNTSDGFFVESNLLLQYIDAEDLAKTGGAGQRST